MATKELGLGDIVQNNDDVVFDMNIIRYVTTPITLSTGVAGLINYRRYSTHITITGYIQLTSSFSGGTLNLGNPVFKIPIENLARDVAFIGYIREQYISQTLMLQANTGNVYIRNPLNVQVGQIINIAVVIPTS